jgi:hypothetical protein
MLRGERLIVIIDDEPFSPKDRARWFISRSHLYHYADYTEMTDELRLAHNDETHSLDDGTDTGPEGLDSQD